MPPVLLSAGLQDHHRKFVHEIALGSSVPVAAKAAGLSDSMGRQLMHAPAVAEAIHAEVARILRTVAAPSAVRTLQTLMDDKSAPAGIRADCAKFLAKVGGHVEPRAPEQGAALTDLTAMAQDELRAVIDHCEGELASRAKPVDAPVDAPPNPQLTDMLD